MAEYYDSIELEIDGVNLDDVIIELTEKNESNLKPVNTMNRRRRAKGFKAGNSMFSLSLRVEPIDDPRVPSWHKLQKDRKEFSIRRRTNAAGSKPTTWSRCRVASVDETGQDGDSTSSVSVLALERDP